MTRRMIDYEPTRHCYINLECLEYKPRRLYVAEGYNIDYGEVGPKVFTIDIDGKYIGIVSNYAPEYKTIKGTIIQ